MPMCLQGRERPADMEAVVVVVAKITLGRIYDTGGPSKNINSVDAVVKAQTWDMTSDHWVKAKRNAAEWQVC